MTREGLNMCELPITLVCTSGDFPRELSRILVTAHNESNMLISCLYSNIDTSISKSLLSHFEPEDTILTVSIPSSANEYETTLTKGGITWKVTLTKV